ncbi:hypothetical protein GGX14DRAFT_327721, partial [Mycena pura]
LSPMPRMPLDMLQNIFMHCLPPRLNCVMSDAEAPLLLGRVCLSQSTRQLWFRLHIVEPRMRSSTPRSSV